MATNPQGKQAQSKEEKRAARAAKRASGRAQRQQLWQAFNIQRKQDNKLIPLMILSVLGMAAVFYGIGLLWGGQWFMLIIGIMFGVLLAFWVFSKRVEQSVYARAAGEAGAAGWALSNLRSSAFTPWLVTQTVAATGHLDAVHRVIGRPGIILVAEGAQSRVKPLVTQQRKRLARVVSTTPIYELYVGEGEGEVPLKRLSRELTKLPMNISKDEVYALNSRLEAMANHNGAPGMPKGPMPKGGKMPAEGQMNRRARRMQQRRGGDA